MIVGSGRFRYRVNADWAKLPEGWSFKEVGESARALLAVARLLITRRQCSPSSPNPGAAWSRSNLARAAGALDCPGGAQDADPGVVRARAEPEVRIHLPPAESLGETGL